MKQKTFVRAVCLLLAVLMVMGVMVSALSTLSSAAVIKKKNSVHTARQPDLTFYDLDLKPLYTVAADRIVLELPVFETEDGIKFKEFIIEKDGKQGGDAGNRGNDSGTGL